MTTFASPSSSNVAPSASSSSGRIFNFSAGPGVLPEEVLRQAQQDVWNIDGSGIGVMEHSHRGKVIDRVWDEAERDLREIGGIPANYKAIWLTGGASQQFFQVPMNLMSQGLAGGGGSADYLLTGHWAKLAVKEAQRFGAVHVACTSEDKNFSYIPTAAATKYSPSPAYVHYTSNNTIFGTEFRSEPANRPANVPLVCDMSSNMFAKPVDISKYGLIYAGAQKNLGPAGVTLVIVRDDLIEKGNTNMPALLQYRTHAKDGSRHNTPPVFAVYMVGLVLKWIKGQGGLAAMAQRNTLKAKHIYDVLDSSTFFKGTAEPASRSLMNICFRTPTEALDDKFVKDAKGAGFDGLKGHRSAGGMRASVYNAFPPEGAKALAQFMRDFERTNG
ncbi:MAG: 3-phosphoserine/phosphohydroxythreonine transaminase [Phycisphaerales bacterium]|nr:3-phosphoserine/phosphohydroxythreonine transaminase [Phycisphaerales bacterium]